VEDDGVLLAMLSERTFESVGSGRSPTRDVRIPRTNVYRKGSAYLPYNVMFIGI